jgi:hypothetical protein
MTPERAITLVAGQIWMRRSSSTSIRNKPPIGRKQRETHGDRGADGCAALELLRQQLADWKFPDPAGVKAATEILNECLACAERQLREVEGGV